MAKISDDDSIGETLTHKLWELATQTLDVDPPPLPRLPPTQHRMEATAQLSQSSQSSLHFEALGSALGEEETWADGTANAEACTEEVEETRWRNSDETAQEVADMWEDPVEGATMWEDPVEGAKTREESVEGATRWGEPVEGTRTVPAEDTGMPGGSMQGNVFTCSSECRDLVADSEVSTVDTYGQLENLCASESNEITPDDLAWDN